jgi:hypothetical protein
MSRIIPVIPVEEFFSDTGDGILRITLESESCVVSVDVWKQADELDEIIGLDAGLRGRDGSLRVLREEFCDGGLFSRHCCVDKGKGQEMLLPCRRAVATGLHRRHPLVWEHRSLAIKT